MQHGFDRKEARSLVEASVPVVPQRILVLLMAVTLFLNLVVSICLTPTFPRLSVRYGWSAAQLAVLTTVTNVVLAGGIYATPALVELLRGDIPFMVISLAGM